MKTNQFWQRQRDYLDRIAQENRTDPMMQPKALLSLTGILLMLLLNISFPMLFAQTGQWTACILSSICLCLFLLFGGLILYIRRDEWRTWERKPEQKETEREIPTVPVLPDTDRLIAEEIARYETYLREYKQRSSQVSNPMGWESIPDNEKKNM